ncbi:hypothetical protein B9Y75_03570 [Stenotrophomonas maltophilia]|nr:hypothetical protein B9Y75_03570 [Stenotrophomonas maltophilia]
MSRNKVQDILGRTDQAALVQLYKNAITNTQSTRVRSNECQRLNKLNLSFKAVIQQTSSISEQNVEWLTNQLPDQ